MEKDEEEEEERLDFRQALGFMKKDIRNVLVEIKTALID